MISPKCSSGDGTMDDGVRYEVTRDPIDPPSWDFALGVLCIETDRLETAAVAFDEALRLDPENESAANNLLGLLIHLGRRAEAERIWREIESRGLAVDPALEKTMRARGP